MNFLFLTSLFRAILEYCFLFVMVCKYVNVQHVSSILLLYILDLESRPTYVIVLYGLLSINHIIFKLFYLLLYFTVLYFNL